MRFYIQTKNDEKAIEWILKTGEVAQDRLRTRYTHTDRVDLEGDVKKWVSVVSEGSDAPFNIIDQMKAREGGDYFKFETFQRTNYLRAYATRPIPELDLQFWSRRLQMIDLMKKYQLKSVKDILNFMASIEIDKSSIKWPLDVLKDKKGNVRSVVSLACSLNGLLGNSSALLVNDQGIILCVLFDKEGSWIWNADKGELIQTSIENFHNSPELRKSISGQEKDDFSYELFCYPEAFCLRNQLISDLVSMDEDVPPFALSPTLERLRLKEKKWRPGNPVRQ